MSNEEFSYFAKKREAAYAARAAERERKAEAERKAVQEQRDRERLHLEKGSFVISILSLILSAGALAVSVIALLH